MPRAEHRHVVYSVHRVRAAGATRKSAVDITSERPAHGVVSRVTPVHTVLRNCTRDEGGPFEVGNQVDLKPPQAAVVKSNGGERCGKVETRFRQV